MYFCPDCMQVFEESLIVKPICPSQVQHKNPQKRLLKMSTESINVYVACMRSRIIIRDMVDAHRGCVFPGGILSVPSVPTITLGFISRDYVMTFYEKHKASWSLFRVWNLPKIEKSHRVDEDLSLVTSHILKSTQSVSSMKRYEDFVQIHTDRDVVDLYEIQIVAGGDKFRFISESGPSPQRDNLIRKFYENYWDYCKEFYSLLDTI